MKFGKKIQEELEHIEPEWQRYVIPYKRLKKAIKSEDQVGYGAQWKPVISTIWSDKLNLASELSTQVAECDIMLSKDFYPMLVKSLLALKKFLVEAFNDTKQRIAILRDQLIGATNPFKKDIKVWKEVFSIYKGFEFWNISTLADLKGVKYTTMKKQFDLFVNKLERRGLGSKLTSPKSKEAIVMFLEANQQILSLIKFCELNQVAATKIMKKFAKSAHYDLDRAVVKKDTSLLYTYPLKIRSMWWEIISQTIPSLDDYSCPVCLEVYWKPTKLGCGHTFCHWCCMQAHARGQYDCPLCRAPGVMGIRELKETDKALSNHLKLYFPEEVKAKKDEIEKQLMLSGLGHIRGAEFMASHSCSIM